MRIDNLSGACDAPSPLRPGSAVEAEFWKGKITTVFAGDQSFTTADNPVHNASVAVLSLAAGIAIGTLALAILAVQFAIARIRSPAAKSGIIATRAERPHLWPRMEAAAAAPADLGMTAAVLSVAGFPVGLISVGVVFPRPEGWTFFQNAAFLAAAALEFVAMTTVTDRLAKRFATQLLTPGGRVFTLAWQGLAFVAQVATWLLVGHAVQ